MKNHGNEVRMERCVEVEHYHKKEKKKKRVVPIYSLGIVIA